MVSFTQNTGQGRSGQEVIGIWGVAGQWGARQAGIGACDMSHNPIDNSMGCDRIDLAVQRSSTNETRGKQAWIR